MSRVCSVLTSASTLSGHHIDRRPVGTGGAMVRSSSLGHKMLVISSRSPPSYQNRPQSEQNRREMADATVDASRRVATFSAISAPRQTQDLAFLRPNVNANRKPFTVIYIICRGRSATTIIRAGASAQVAWPRGAWSRRRSGAGLPRTNPASRRHDLRKRDKESGLPTVSLAAKHVAKRKKTSRKRT